jgi:hypothetical protein
MSVNMFDYLGLNTYLIVFTNSLVIPWSEPKTAFKWMLVDWRKGQREGDRLPIGNIQKEDG